MRVSVTLTGVVGLALVTGLGVLGLEVGRAHLAGSIYRDRLSALADEYAVLRDQYNRAISRTAVTLVKVEDGEISVVVRTADGGEREIETPFEPGAELYVDYVVLDGRLWARRVFDEHTPASQGVVIEPSIDEVDWASSAAPHGKAIYRRLDGDGLWTISVSGNGALSLEPLEGMSREAGAPELATLPPVEHFMPRERSALTERPTLTALDVLRALIDRLGISSPAD
ncbi:MAG: hypothetical protein AAGI30_13140 [Planctomycetota bacterium]